MISYQTEGVKMPDIKKKKTTGWIKEVAACYGKRVGEIAYIFCSDDKILEVNRQYLQHDYYTDIITFDYTEGNKISTIVKATVFPATYSSAWILSAAMQNNLSNPTTASFTG